MPSTSSRYDTGRGERDAGIAEGDVSGAKPSPDQGQGPAGQGGVQPPRSNRNVWPWLVGVILILGAAISLFVMRAQVQKPTAPSRFAADAHRDRGTSALKSRGDLARGAVRLVGHRNLATLEVRLHFEDQPTKESTDD
jgi:hypothetical protein